MSYVHIIEKSGEGEDTKTQNFYFDVDKLKVVDPSNESYWYTSHLINRLQIFLSVKPEDKATLYIYTPKKYSFGDTPWETETLKGRKGKKVLTVDIRVD